MLHCSVSRDTAVQERFNTFTKQFFRGAQVGDEKWPIRSLLKSHDVIDQSYPSPPGNTASVWHYQYGELPNSDEVDPDHKRCTLVGGDFSSKLSTQRTHTHLSHTHAHTHTHTHTCHTHACMQVGLEHISLVVVGNKMDLAESRQVPRSNGERVRARNDQSRTPHKVMYSESS